MSDTNQGSIDEQSAGTDEAPAPSAANELFEVHGKKFDLSTADGKGQLKGFLEAMSSELGRKNNEVGTLRKFAAAIKPDSNESALLEKARAKAKEGDIDEALDTVFSYSKTKIKELEQRQAIEKENDETWDAYLSSRPDLLKLFDKKTVRKVSELDLKIYDSEDPFKLLDEFWLPKTTKVEGKPADAAPNKKDVPPSTLSGGSQSSKAASKGESKDADKVDLFSIFDSISKPKRLSVK